MKNNICQSLWIFLVALVFGGLTLTAYAQGGNQYIFPGITTNNNITIGNLNPVETTAEVDFYDNSGKLNSLSVDLPAGQQQRVNPASVSLTTFTGSVVITAPVPLSVSADQFEGNTAFDFIYPASVGSTLLIPFTGAEVASVDVNIFNPGPNQAEVKVVLVQSNGVHTTTRIATLDPLHSTTITLSSGTSASYVFVTTTNILRPVSPVAASAVIRSFNPSVTGAATRSDIAFTTSTATDIYTSKTQVPFFTQGPDYFSLVQIDNLANAQQTILVTATQADGTPFPGTSNPATIVLPPYASTRQEMAQLFGSTNTTFSTGTITAVAQGTLFNGNPTGGPPGPITAAVIMGNLSEPSVAVMTPQSAASTFALQVRGTGREFFTGLSLANANSNDAHVNMSFVLDGGVTLTTVPVTIPKGNTTVTTLADLMPEAVGNGYVLVKSDVPITVVGLDGRSDNSAIATRLPVYASPQFVPPPQTSFLITGTVRDTSTGINGSNIGVPNVALTLTGPVNATYATDLAGTFYFRDLPPGTYSLSALPVGFTATPKEEPITITNSNSRNNNFAIALQQPDIQTVTPASAQVVSSTSASGGINVAVQGTNSSYIQPSVFTGNIFTKNINKFTTGTVFVFDGSQVETTVSSPTLLNATVPNSLLVTTGTVQVVVRNLGPSGDFVDSAPFSFIIGTGGPTLTNVTGVPNPLIAGKVTAPFQVTINGSGFTPATTVRVNFVNRQTKFVNQNQVIGTVLPQDLTIPGNVPITVQNPNTVDSQPFQLVLDYPIPVLSQIAPNSITAQLELNAQPVLVTLSGTDFSQSPTNPLNYAQVQVNGQQVQTSYISSTQLTALVPANATSLPGVLQISVANPTPNLAPSNAAPMFVNNPIATITSVNGGGVTWNPNSPPNDFFIQPVVVIGTNFSPNAVAWVNVPCDTLGLRQAMSTTRNSAEQIVAGIPIRCAGNYSIAIANPQPGGGLSAAATLNVPSVAASTVAPVTPVTGVGVATPSISVYGGGVTWGSNSVPFTQMVVITGTNLPANAVAYVNPPCENLVASQALSSAWKNSGEIDANITIGCSGNYSIVLIDPQSGVKLSAPATLVVPAQ